MGVAAAEEEEEGRRIEEEREGLEGREGSTRDSAERAMSSASSSFSLAGVKADGAGEWYLVELCRTSRKASIAGRSGTVRGIGVKRR